MKEMNRSDPKQYWLTQIVSWIQKSIEDSLFIEYKEKIYEFCSQVAEDE